MTDRQESDLLLEESNLRSCLLSTHDQRVVRGGMYLPPCFEPNLCSVRSMGDALLCVASGPCTTVSKEIFSCGLDSETYVTIVSMVPGCCMGVGIIGENCRGHESDILGTLPKSVGVLVKDDVVSFATRWEDEGQYPVPSHPVLPDNTNVVRVRVQYGDVEIFWNDASVGTAQTGGMMDRYRLAVSFTAAGQAVRLGRGGDNSCHTLDHLRSVDAAMVHGMEEAIFRPTTSYNFLASTSELIVRGSTLLCTSDNTTTAVSREVFGVHLYRTTICDGCERIPLNGNRWRCHGCGDFDLCQDCYDTMFTHEHPKSEFRCGLGGVSFEVTMRIEDVNPARPMMFGLVPRVFLSPLKDLAHQISACIVFSDGGISIISSKEVKFRSVEKCVIKTGDLVGILFDGRYVSFSINSCFILKIPVPPEQYRFAVSLCGTNQSVSVVDGDFAITIPRGSTLTVTNDAKKLSESCRKCGISVPLEHLGDRGVAVDFDDCDGTVGVALPKGFQWFPRSSVEIDHDNACVAMPPMGLTVGASVVLHPYHSRNTDGVRVGAVGTVHAIECDKVCVQWPGLASVLDHTNIEVLLHLGVGARVVRNPYFWRWGDQDRGGPGTVVEMVQGRWARVIWDDEGGVEEHYRWGHDNAFDLLRVQAEPAASLPPSRGGAVFSNQECCSSLVKESHFIPLSELVFEETRESELGRGRYGTVFRGVWDGNDVAIKKMMHTSAKEARDLGVLERIAHPNVVGMMGWSTDESKQTIYLVLDLVVPGSLAKVVHSLPPAPASQGGPLGWSRFFYICIGIAHALHYFARQNLVHRDIKPENILLAGNNYDVKVTDFGLAKFMKREDSTQMSAVCGTPVYMSPETWNTTSRITPQSDVHSLGLVMAYMLTGHTPRTHCENMFQILYDLMTLKKVVEVPPDVPEGIRKLVVDCQAFEPKQRPTPIEIIRRLNDCELSLRLDDSYSYARSSTGDLITSPMAPTESYSPMPNTTLCSFATTEMVEARPITTSDLVDRVGLTHDAAAYVMSRTDIASGMMSPAAPDSMFLGAVERHVMSLASVVQQTGADDATLREAAASGSIPIIPVKGASCLLSIDYSMLLSILTLRKKSTPTAPNLTLPNFALAADVTEQQLHGLLDRGVVKVKRIPPNLLRVPFQEVARLRSALLDLDVVCKQCGVCAGGDTAGVVALARELCIVVYERPSNGSLSILQQDVLEVLLPRVASHTMMTREELCDHVGISHQTLVSLIQRAVVEDTSHYPRTQQSEIVENIMVHVVPFAVVQQVYMEGLQMSAADFVAMLDTYEKDNLIAPAFDIRQTRYIFKTDKHELDRLCELGE